MKELPDTLKQIILREVQAASYDIEPEAVLERIECAWLSEEPQPEGNQGCCPVGHPGVQGPQGVK